MQSVIYIINAVKSAFYIFYIHKQKCNGGRNPGCIFAMAPMNVITSLSVILLLDFLLSYVWAMHNHLCKWLAFFCGLRPQNFVFPHKTYRTWLSLSFYRKKALLPNITINTKNIQNLGEHYFSTTLKCVDLVQN